MSAARTLPVLLEAFFTDRLIRQRQASPHTLASYRDTFCLLLAYAQQKLRKAPSEVTLPEGLSRPMLKYSWQTSLVEQPTLPVLGFQYCCSSCA
jgi:integrase/recombinase XerD